MGYKDKFDIKIREKIVAHNYSNSDLRLSDYKSNINILIVMNMSWTPEFGQNLSSTIPIKIIELINY